MVILKLIYPLIQSLIHDVGVITALLVSSYYMQVVLYLSYWLVCPEDQIHISTSPIL